MLESERLNGGLSWLEEALGHQPQSSQHIVGPKSDRLLWRDAQEGSEAIGKLTEDTQKWPAFNNLLQDTFQTFFKPQPELRPEEEVAASHRATRPYVERLMEDPATAQTRTVTVLDELSSAVATLATGQQLAKIVAEDGTLDEALKAGSTPPPQTMAKLNKAVHSACKAGAQEAQEVQEAMVSWGLDGGQMMSVPMGERIDLAKKLASPQFKKIAKMIGRLRNLARSRQGGTLRHHRDELHSISTGNDLSRVLPTELAALGHPLRRLDFGRRFLERGLLQYEVRPIPRESKGPVICLIDGSGSMCGARIEWAAAVGLALLDTAKRQKRDFAACYFDTQILAEFRFERGKADPRQIMEFATVGANGGTDYEVPLRWALERQKESRYKSADIVLISDGECGLSDEFLNVLLSQKRERGLRIFSILIGGTPDELTRWSDRVWAVAQADDDAAGELFAELA